MPNKAIKKAMEKVLKVLKLQICHRKARRWRKIIVSITVPEPVIRTGFVRFARSCVDWLS
jgi:hypothetical protein